MKKPALIALVTLSVLCIGCAASQAIVHHPAELNHAKIIFAKYRLKGVVLKTKTHSFQVAAKDKNGHKVSQAWTTMVLTVKLKNRQELTIKKTFAGSYRRHFLRPGDWIEVVLNSNKKISWIAGGKGALFGPVSVLKATKKSR